MHRYDIVIVSGFDDQIYMYSLQLHVYYFFSTTVINLLNIIRFSLMLSYDFKRCNVVLLLKCQCYPFGNYTVLRFSLYPLLSDII